MRKEALPHIQTHTAVEESSIEVKPMRRIVLEYSAVGFCYRYFGKFSPAEMRDIANGFFDEACRREQNDQD